MPGKLSRRVFLRTVVIGSAGVLAAACQPKVVEKIVKETVLVASMTGEPFSILSAGGRAPVYADDFDPTRHEPRRQYRLASEAGR